MDIVDKKTRSRMMQSVPQSHTAPEIAIRRMLHSAGFRFRLHDPRLPGTPDLVLPRYRVVVFVHGCFWHFHERCKYAKIPASNQEAWRFKLENNVARDQRQIAALHDAGWRVLVVWTCALHSEKGYLTDQMTRWIKREENAEKIYHIRGPETTTTGAIID